MGGLYKLFLKITPIMLLICCICYGILHTFQRANQPNITYLTTEQINIGTEENPEYKTIYRFDMVSYTQNINQNILKRSIEHTIDFEAYDNTLTKFNDIWDNGYQVFDVSKTIANGIVLIINSLILPINVVLIPVRLIAGLLLTGMSLVGININNGYFITNTLTFFLDKLAIPLIQPQTDEQLDPPSEIANQQWRFENDIATLYENNETINVIFTCNNIGYDQIKIQREPSQIGIGIKMYYHSLDNQWIEVYNELVATPWHDNNYKYIVLGNNRGLTDQQETTILAFLHNYAVLVL